MLRNVNIEEYIPFGRDNAVTRAHLCNITGMDDRTVRAHIEGARRHGVVIINLQNGEGYFQPKKEDADLVEAQRKQEYSRAMRILAANKSNTAWLKKCKEQIEWPTST